MIIPAPLISDAFTEIVKAQHQGVHFSAVQFIEVEGKVRFVVL